MPAPYTDSTMLIDGAGEFFIGSNIVAATTASYNSGTKTITTGVAVNPDNLRAGDVISINPDGAGMEYHRVASVSGTTIVLETGLVNVTVTADDVTRYWAVAGHTQGGIAFETQQTVQERNSDQSLDPVAIKGDKRTASLKVGLMEMTAENFATAAAMSPSDIVRNGTTTAFNVGDSSTNLANNRFLAIGSREDGAKVTVKAQKAVNTGNTSLKFDKAGNALLQLDLRLINDGSKEVGKLYRKWVETDPTKDYKWDL